MLSTDALRIAHSHLMAARFTQALAAATPVRHMPPGALLYALALAGTGDAVRAAPLLAAIGAANPAHRHPVLDLLPLVSASAAVLHLRHAVALCPSDPALHAALGIALTETGPMADAIDAFERGTTLAPRDPAAWSNLGKALAAEARFPGARAAMATASRLAPDNPLIAHNQAIITLKSGDMAAGWASFRVRHRLPGRTTPLPGPRLTDLEVAGRTVLLRHDEGFGDTLQFIRYAQILAERGARVIAAMPPPLLRIVATVPGVAETVSLDALPKYDLWAPLLDVPALFDDAIPVRVPYLHAEATTPTLPPGRRLGIVWAGDPTGRFDRQRSISPDALAPLRDRPGIVWISLQLGRPAPGWMHDPMAAVRDFADTAAIIAQLEAVVSVDTAVAHLAGALGKPVLLLDRYDSCWRWLTGRTDSPWYPGLRLFRQAAPGDWASAVTALAATL